MVAATLRATGRRVGLYTSPHLESVRERIRVDGVPIGADAFAAWTERLRPTIDRTGASFFEATTAIAFADFAAREVEIAVVEVGLGGRLDSTNVLTPLAAAVTVVALEHAEYLGTNLDAIAREKAGIAKPGIPFVIGERDPSVREILVAEAEARGAHVVVPDVDTLSAAPWIRPALVGAHQRRNAALAVALCEHLPAPFTPDRNAVARGVAAARLPGRFDKRGLHLFDVAHNPHAMEALVRALADRPVPTPLHGVIAIMSDKPWAHMLTPLVPRLDRLWLTVAPGTPPDRVWDLAELASWSEGTTLRGGSRPVVEPEFERALGDASAGAGTVLVTGSCYTVGAALAALPGFSPIR